MTNDVHNANKKIQLTTQTTSKRNNARSSHPTKKHETHDTEVSEYGTKSHHGACKGLIPNVETSDRDKQALHQLTSGQRYYLDGSEEICPRIRTTVSHGVRAQRIIMVDASRRSGFES